MSLLNSPYVKIALLLEKEGTAQELLIFGLEQYDQLKGSFSTTTPEELAGFMAFYFDVEEEIEEKINQLNNN